MRVTVKVKGQTRQYTFLRSPSQQAIWPSNADSNGAVYQVSLWTLVEAPVRLRGDAANRVYVLLTTADEQTGRPWRRFYAVGQRGLEIAFSGAMAPEAFEFGQQMGQVFTPRLHEVA